MALLFPDTPTPGELFPVNPGTPGVTQYRWNNTKGVWDAVLNTVSLGAANQGAYNTYQWPATDGTLNQQLTTDGAGNLAWGGSAIPSMQVLGLLEPFDGTNLSFTLIESGSTTPFTPVPSTNLVIFLGGVPQIPSAAYSVVGNTVTFTQAPLTGNTFYGISNVVL
jgi:hypothetical protein